jgi:hypothetical protein
MWAIGELWGVEALAAAGATNRAQAKDVEEPVPASAMRAVEGFRVAVGARSSVGEHRF